jgi:hypothetical protein
MAPMPFNWFELDRGTLYYYFYSLNKSVVGKSLTPDKIQKLISKHLKQFLPIKIVKFFDPTNVKRKYIYMGGMYYSDYDRKHKTAIELNLHYHPDDTTIKITEYRWKRMSLRFADIMLHEMIHMRQFRSRNFKMIPGYQSTAELSKDRKQQEYFGDRDEMGAFAYNIACEMIDRFGYDIGKISLYMDTNATRHKHMWWHSYLKAFNYDHSHPIIRRMKNLIMRQLENAYLGKPFKTTNHLTY